MRVFNNIDLRGTPFRVMADQFTLWGNYPSGATAYSSNNQVVDLTGGSTCGWNSTQGLGSSQLRLSYGLE